MARDIIENACHAKNSSKYLGFISHTTKQHKNKTK